MSSDIETYLAEVEKRAEAATEGPWTANDNRVCWQIDAEMHAVVTTQFCYATETEANAHLIASCRTDIPRLVAELRKTRAAHDSVTGGLELLKVAIEADDPKSELLLRVQDLLSESRKALEGGDE